MGCRDERGALTKTSCRPSHGLTSMISRSSKLAVTPIGGGGTVSIHKTTPSDKSSRPIPRRAERSPGMARTESDHQRAPFRLRTHREENPSSSGHERSELLVAGIGEDRKPCPATG